MWPCPKTSGVVPEAFLAYLKNTVKTSNGIAAVAAVAVPMSGTECIVQGSFCIKAPKSTIHKLLGLYQKLYLPINFFSSGPLLLCEPLSQELCLETVLLLFCHPCLPIAILRQTAVAAVAAAAAVSEQQWQHVQTALA